MYDLLNSLANATAGISFFQRLHCDKIPVNVVLKALFSEVISGNVKGKAQDRKRCVKAMDVSAFGAIFETCAKIDIIFAELASQLAVKSDFSNRNITVVTGVKFHINSVLRNAPTFFLGLIIH